MEVEKEKSNNSSRGVNSCPDSLTNLDNRVLAALDQSGLPAFLPHSGKLAHQVMSARACGLERAPARTNDSPTTFRACRSARGPGLLHRGVPPQASPIQAIPEQGVSPSCLPAPASACTRGRTSPSCTCVLIYLTLSRLSSFLESRTGFSTLICGWQYEH
jgi:hypothetical protein